MRVKSSTARRPMAQENAAAAPDPKRQSHGSYVSFVPGRIDPATTTFSSANDLAIAMRRAAVAHGEPWKHNGQRDAN